MKSVKVKKEELLKVIRENLKKHQEAFAAAWAEFVKDYKDLAGKMIEKIDQANPQSKPSMAISLLVPEDHSADYERVIKMLEMSVDEEVRLEQHEASSYLMDEWQWKERWAENTMSYASKSGFLR